MKLELVNYKCAGCGSQFLAPEIGENSYGEFLLRSDAGELAYVDAIEDRSYEEVNVLLASLASSEMRDENRRAVVLRRIYGPVACDPDSAGKPFILAAKPKCPSCASAEIASWEFLNPPSFVDIPVPSVRHSHWNSLEPSEKVNAILSYIKHDKVAEGRTL